MRGSVRLVACASACLLLASVLVNVDGLRCDRTPSSGAKSPPDGRFYLTVSGNPDKYIPDEVYTVTLQGQRATQVPSKFSGFMLVAEAEIKDPVANSLSNGHDAFREAGTFQTFGDSLTKYSDKCPNAVTHTSSMPKSEIQVLWTAPQAGSGCVTLKATVIEHHDIWYMDGGPLSRILCEDNDDGLDTQPMIVNPCCACDEAKYEVTFEGVWSRHTHPKDFPPNEWMTRFSDVIGASHSVDYRFWNYGEHASEGLRQVAEHGATRKLESELKAESDHIRTIIKARGISYPNLNGKTFAVFRVDNRHHLISLVSMMDPSPDWIVGVSGLELCLKNCSWVESKVINLYPWDAGTDSGPTYLSPDQPTTPRDFIKRIRTNFPNDPRSPFYDTSGTEMKPLARLYLSRQRLYEKTCDPSIAGNREDGGTDESQGGEDGSSAGAGGGGGRGVCATDPWGPWSPCSVSCGRGQRYRQRSYLDEARAEAASCDKKLTARQKCYGSRRHCKVPSEDEPDPATTTGSCAVTEWSDWSECSNRCGDGFKTRSRKYKNRVSFKRCFQGYGRKPVMQQTLECTGEETDCAEEENSEGTVYEDPKCPMEEWSEWSPCSATCGLGKQMRKRLPAEREDNQLAMARSFKRLHKRFSFWGSSEPEKEPEKEEENPEEGSQVVEGEGSEEPQLSEECKHMKVIEEVVCNSGITCEGETIHPFGGLDPDNQIGSNLAGPVEDKKLSGDGSLTGVDGTTLPPYFNGHFKPERRRKGGNQVFEESVGAVRNCKVSEWSQWSECTVSCGNGVKKKTRRILQHPINGGKPCPKALLKHKVCKQRSCINDEGSAEDDPQVNNEDDDGTDPSWGPARKPDHAGEQCVLSEWSQWSPCSETCGAAAVKQRTRSLLEVPPNINPVFCGHRLETESCGLLSCPMY